MPHRLRHWRQGQGFAADADFDLISVLGAVRSPLPYLHPLGTGQPAILQRCACLTPGLAAACVLMGVMHGPALAAQCDRVEATKAAVTPFQTSEPQAGEIVEIATLVLDDAGFRRLRIGAGGAGLTLSQFVLAMYSAALNRCAGHEEIDILLLPPSAAAPPRRARQAPHRQGATSAMARRCNAQSGSHAGVAIVPDRQHARRGGGQANDMNEANDASGASDATPAHDLSTADERLGSEMPAAMRGALARGELALSNCKGVGAIRPTTVGLRYTQALEPPKAPSAKRQAKSHGDRPACARIDPAVGAQSHAHGAGLALVVDAHEIDGTLVLSCSYCGGDGRDDEVGGGRSAAIVRELFSLLTGETRRRPVTSQSVCGQYLPKGQGVHKPLDLNGPPDTVPVPARRMRGDTQRREGEKQLAKPARTGSKT